MFALVNLLVLFILSIVVVLVANGLGLLHVPGTLWWIVPLSIVLFFPGVGFLFWVGRSLRRMSAPLGDLVDAAGRISEGDYSQQVPERGTPDVRSLVRAFNGMAARLKLTEEQRRDLMADITHELRTPLTVIQGNLEGMVDGVYPADESHIKLALEETHILSRLVDDLRTLALAESGALQLKKETTDLAVLMGETVAAFRAQADAAGVKLDVQTPNEGLLVNIDPERIRQVLANLITNAMRYTERGGLISLKAEMSSEAGGKKVVILVKDNGKGISADVLPNVFNRFYKSRDSSGTGLGLPIARHLVEAHGGSISIESEEGKGTSIQISLPVED
jgi:signal transduction histidine kinase